MNEKKDAPVRCGDRAYESLPLAVAAAAAGDTLVLRRDITLQQTLVLDKALNLTTDGAPRTIRAEHNGPVLRLTAAATVAGSGEDAPLVLDGCGVERQDALVHLAGEGSFFRYVTVTGGNSGGRGGALYAAAGAAARMEYCALRENRAAVGGAGFVEAGGDLKLHRCTITDNHAEEKGGAFRLLGKMLPTGCTITRNTAGAPHGKGERMAQLPPFAGREMALLDGDGTELAVWQRTEGGDSYDTYLRRLEEAGYACAAQRELDGSRFATLTNHRLTVTLMDTPALENTVRLAVDDGEIPQLDLGCGAAVAQPCLALLGTGCPTMQNGAALLFRLADGRFLIIDGGYTEDAEQLYATMRRLAGESPLRIAAWVLTHAHGDHLEAFLHFWQQPWASEVVLESLLLNLPGDEIFAQGIVGPTQL